jgi:murein DD-endopeptidase MepM/ murein hydrolase activator NlpD
MGFKFKLLVLLILPAAVCFFALQSSKGNQAVISESDQLKIPTQHDSLLLLFSKHPLNFSDGFDFPVGKPNAKGYYNAQPFKKNNHLGDDWNGNGGGNSDLGDTIYAVSNGLITESIQYFGGWGKVIRQVSVWNTSGEMEAVETVYAHLDKMLVRKNEWVKRGQAIATMGNAEGKYYAHLHLEMKSEILGEIGGGYSTDTTGYMNPTRFIKSHRKILSK